MIIKRIYIRDILDYLGPTVVSMDDESQISPDELFIDNLADDILAQSFSFSS